MYTENIVQMHGPVARIFDLAADVERWPVILPHYRWVRRLSGTPQKRVVAMAARRNFIPVQWVSIQEVYPAERRIVYRHIGGFTKGMYVEWTMEPLQPANPDGGQSVKISHDFTLRWPLIGGIVAQKIVGDFFVHYIANQTLNRIKQLVEMEEPVSLAQPATEKE